MCHFNFGVPGIPFAGLVLIVKSKLEKPEIPDFAMIFRAPCWYCQLYFHLEEAGDLCIFDESLGRAMFVSHQWVTSQHPDPNFEQLQVLQEALKNMLSGAGKLAN